MLYEELPDPISQISQSPTRSPNYVLKLCMAIIFLIVWLAVQGIISFQIGSIFNSPLLIVFGIFSFSQIIIILYIYHKLLTEHYKLTLIHIGNYFDSRKKTEKLIAQFVIVIFVSLAITTTYISFYTLKQEGKHPPGTIPPVNTNNHAISGLSWQILVFGIYVIHIYIILILSAWYLSISQRSEVWYEATIWAGLFLPIAYIIFINSQLLFDKRREVIFTLVIALTFLLYATKLGWMYLWCKVEDVGSEILHSSEIEDLEEE